METKTTLIDSRIKELNDKISFNIDTIPKRFYKDPKKARNFLNSMLDAQEILLKKDIESKDLLDVQWHLSEYQIEYAKWRASTYSTFAVVGVIYLLVILIWQGLVRGILSVDVSASELNKLLFIGIPHPVWIWSVIGSFTSMLVYSMRHNFNDILDLVRWFFYRPIVGVIMGALTYLLLITGLIVFVGKGDTQTPELIWVIAFIGSFSDKLSIDLLEKIMGKIKTKETETKETETNAQNLETSNSGTTIQTE